VRSLLLNGVPVLLDGAWQPDLRGRVLRKAGPAAVPGAAWKLARPEDHGWSGERLKAAWSYAESIDTAAVMVVDDGHLVGSFGDTAKRYLCHSVRKSFLSALYGLQVEAGTIELDRSLAELGIDDDTPLTDAEKSATVRQLLKARSGVYVPAAAETPNMKKRRPARGSHAPGTYWYYNNWDFNVLGTIFAKRAKTSIGEAFARDIAGPIGMQDFRPKDVRRARIKSSRHAAYPFRMSARDMARVGLLVQRDGRWGARQVLPAGWVAESTQSHSKISSTRGYGYMWWTADGGRFHSRLDLGSRVITAQGYRGHYIFIVPAERLVVIHRVDTYQKGTRVTGSQFAALMTKILAARAR